MSIRGRIPATSAALALLLVVACARSGNEADTHAEKKPVAPAVPVSTRSSPGALDGRTYIGKLVDNGKESPEDQLIFADGTFRSLGCDEYGFMATPYSATATGDATTFDAVSTSEKEGKMTWHGVVKGETLTGTALWEKAGQASIEYTYVATIKK